MNWKMSMYGRDPWGGPLETHAVDSATDDDRSRSLYFDKAALLRPLDETQQSWLLGPGEKHAEVCGPGLHHRQSPNLPVDGGDCPRRRVLSWVHHSHCQDGPAPPRLIFNLRLILVLPNVLVPSGGAPTMAYLVGTTNLRELRFF